MLRPSLKPDTRSCGSTGNPQVRGCSGPSHWFWSFWFLLVVTPSVTRNEICGNFDLNLGAPRSMKMGTILSPWPYDAAACHALQPANLRRPAILRYASGAAFFPD